MFKELQEFNLTEEAIFAAVLKIKEKREKGEGVSLLEELKRQLLQQEQEPSRVPVRMDTPPQSPDFNKGNRISNPNPPPLLVLPPSNLLKEKESDEPMNSPGPLDPLFFLF